MKKRILAYALAMSMVVGAVPTTAWAEEGTVSTGCTHVHDSECGYVAAVEGVACDKGCTDTDGDGVLDHAEDCAYVEAVEGVPCGHVCDTTCGGVVVPEFVAKIRDETYATLDKAVTAAVDGDTIEIGTDCETVGLNLSKDLTIKGTGDETITFEEKGIALWGHALTFEDCNVEMTNIKSTPYGEWTWMAICASRDASLTLNDVEMTMDGDDPIEAHAIYFCSNNKLNLNDSKLTIKNYKQDALEWDGGDWGYNVNLVNSTFVSDHNRSGFTGNFIVTAENSKIDVINSRGNGSNGSDYVIDDSKVNFINNGSHGLSARNLTIQNNSDVVCNENGLYGVTFFGEMDMDGTSELDVIENATSGKGGGLRASGAASKVDIAAGADVEINDNHRNGLENYGTFTIEDGVKTFTILNNYETNNGGGIYNEGTLVLPEEAQVMYNRAGQTGGGICNQGTVTIPDSVEFYNNHAVTAGDDIYNREAGTITFGATGSDWKLDGVNGEEEHCKHKIDGWYDDSEFVDGQLETTGRWQAHADKAEREMNHIIEFTDFTDGTATVVGVKALKAAHGILPASVDIDKTIVDENKDGYKRGETIEYTIKVENDGPVDLTCLTVEEDPTESVSDKLVFSDWKFTGFECDNEDVIVTIEDKDSVYINELPVGETVTLYFEAKVADDAAKNAPLDNDVTVKAEQGVSATDDADTKVYVPGGSGGGGGNDIDIRVKKVWKLDDGGEATDSVKVTLYKNGKEYDTVKLNEKNDWKYTWENLSKSPEWTVKETDVPDGFKVSVDKKGSTTFIITNDDIGKEPVKPDETPDALNGDDHFDYVVGYPDGKVHPEWNITRAEVAAIFFRLLKDEVRDGNLTFDNDFDDVPKGMWYTSSISTMAKLGIVYGRDDGGFDPNTNITRAEFAAIAARFDSQPYSGPDKFSDISGHWAARHINRAAEKGWIVGYPDGTFAPDRYITRAEAVTLINRVLNRLPESPEALHPDMKVWPDNMNKTAWFYLAMQEATNSHEYKKVNDIYERWPEMLPPRDWAKYLNER